MKMVFFLFLLYSRIIWYFSFVRVSVCVCAHSHSHTYFHIKIYICCIYVAYVALCIHNMCAAWYVYRQMQYAPFVCKRKTERERERKIPKTVVCTYSLFACVNVFVRTVKKFFSSQNLFFFFCIPSLFSILFTFFIFVVLLLWFVKSPLSIAYTRHQQQQQQQDECECKRCMQWEKRDDRRFGSVFVCSLYISFIILFSSIASRATSPTSPLEHMCVFVCCMYGYMVFVNCFEASFFLHRHIFFGISFVYARSGRETCVCTREHAFIYLCAAILRFLPRITRLPLVMLDNINEMNIIYFVISLVEYISMLLLWFFLFCCFLHFFVGRRRSFEMLFYDEFDHALVYIYIYIYIIHMCTSGFPFLIAHIHAQHRWSMHNTCIA